LVAAPSPSYGKSNKFKEKVKRLYEKATKVDKGTEEDHKKAKDIAGKVLDQGMGIPGAGKMIEYIDKKNKETGFYDKKKKGKYDKSK
jgi:hypothetical protein|tara:strand:+ start:19269 stop:19529 length:261 start_codon:yes stop_codon:yes gene_type:complete